MKHNCAAGFLPVLIRSFSPLQKYGDNARARKLYDQDSDDDDDEDDLEPNPKLEPGKTSLVDPHPLL